MTPSSKAGETAASSKAPSTEAGESAGNKPLTMRGRKRHKCMVCGNIARSRCPFFSCKGCCVKAGNSCQIHVLKASPSGDGVQGPAATAAAPHTPVPSTIVKHPYDTLRLRTVKPLGLLTKKEAFYTNSWRFRKLRAHIEGNKQIEDETFDRYMRNMLLLEEIFNGSGAEKADGGIDSATIVPRLRQRSSSKKRDAHKQKLKRTIDRSLQKLHKGEEIDDIPENEDFYLNAYAARRELKRMKVQSADGKERLRRMEVFSVLLDKLKVVENQEDFDLCLKMYEENFVPRKANAGKREGASSSQTAALEPRIISSTEAMEVTTPLVQTSDAPDLTFNVSFKSRLDPYGVMRQSWKVDETSFAEPCGCPFDVPLSCLESL